jgi:S1-C subfamily serine protease
MRWLALALGVLALALAGCGDDGDDGSADRPPASTQEQTATAPEEDAPDTREEVVAAQGGGTFDARRLFERDAPGVVTIYSIFGGGGLEAILGGEGGGGGVGSGFVIDGEGRVATNAHVVSQGEGDELETADEVYVEFADGNRVEAEVVGSDPFADIALLKVEPKGLDLHPLELATSDSVEVGEPVAAIGSPFGQRQSLSVGVVSATDRSVESLTDFQISGAVQTDAAINPGNSGGPLVDGQGRVIGVNQQIRTSSGANEGVGYAVPVDLVKRSLESLERDGEVRYAYLGVSTQDLYPQLVERFDLDVEEGAWVQEVTAGGPAEDAGVKGGGRAVRFQASRVNPGGDVITKVGDTPIRDADDLSAAIALREPGEKVALEIHRDGDTRNVEVKLEERPLGSLQRRP